MPPIVFNVRYLYGEKAMVHDQVQDPYQSAKIFSPHDDDGFDSDDVRFFTIICSLFSLGNHHHQHPQVILISVNREGQFKGTFADLSHLQVHPYPHTHTTPQYIHCHHQQKRVTVSNMYAKCKYKHTFNGPQH